MYIVLHCHTCRLKVGRGPAMITVYTVKFWNWNCDLKTYMKTKHILCACLAEVKKSWTTLLARIYEPLVLVNTVISWIRLADLNPCTTSTMYISLTIFLFRSGIAFYFHWFSTVQITVRPKKIYACLWSHVKKIRVGWH